MNIIDGIERANVFGRMFKDSSTWRPWMVFLRALFGLPIEDPDDLALLQRCTGLTEPPKERIRECAAICGRRSGKSFISALIAVYLAVFGDWRAYLSPGEKGMAFIIAVDRLQARIIKEYCSGILNSSKVLARMVKNDLQESIELTNNITIAIKTSSFRTVRGYSCICAILEECAFFRSELFANPDREIAAALKPFVGDDPGELADYDFDALRETWNSL